MDELKFQGSRVCYNWFYSIFLVISGGTTAPNLQSPGSTAHAISGHSDVEDSNCKLYLILILVFVQLHS